MKQKCCDVFYTGRLPLSAFNVTEIIIKQKIEKIS